MGEEDKGNLGSIGEQAHHLHTGELVLRVGSWRPLSAAALRRSPTPFLGNTELIPVVWVRKREPHGTNMGKLALSLASCHRQES